VKVTTRGAPNSYTLRQNAPDRVLQQSNGGAGLPGIGRNRGTRRV